LGFVASFPTIAQQDKNFSQSRFANKVVMITSLSGDHRGHQDGEAEQERGIFHVL
jgi:hypothetical protein